MPNTGKGFSTKLRSGRRKEPRVSEGGDPVSYQDPAELVELTCMECGAPWSEPQLPTFQPGGKLASVTCYRCRQEGEVILE
jgi:hypothetical protein